MKQMMKVKLDKLIHAEWNPRKASDLAPENPEMQKLAASIKQNGLLEPVGVWVRDDGSIVIYGNRRVEAARMAGLSEIDAAVYTQISDATARVLTREENENRFGVDPLLDAKLLQDAVSRGMSQGEVAAAAGVSEATICRRMKLTHLLPEVIDELTGVMEKSHIDTKALEAIAAWCPEIQTQGIKRIKSMSAYSKVIDIKDCRNVFNRLTASVDGTAWIFEGESGAARLAKCRACGKCSGNQPDFFETDQGGRCMDVKCYKHLTAAARQERIDAACCGVPEDHRVEVCSIWDDRFKNLTANKPGKKNAWAYWYWSDWESKCVCKFGPDPKIAEAEAEREREDREAVERQARQEREAGEKTKKEITRKIGKLFTGLEDINEDDVDYPEKEELRKRFVAAFAGASVADLAEMYFEIGDGSLMDYIEGTYDFAMGFKAVMARALPAVRAVLTEEERKYLDSFAD